MPNAQGPTPTLVSQKASSTAYNWMIYSCAALLDLLLFIGSVLIVLDLGFLGTVGMFFGGGFALATFLPLILILLPALVSLGLLSIQKPIWSIIISILSIVGLFYFLGFPLFIMPH
jgi:hypothetical protein